MKIRYFVWSSLGTVIQDRKYKALKVGIVQVKGLLLRSDPCPGSGEAISMKVTGSVVLPPSC